MIDPATLHRAAVLLGAVRHPTVRVEPRANGRGRECVARVWLEDGQHEARDPFPGLALRKLLAARGVHW